MKKEEHLPKDKKPWWNFLKAPFGAKKEQPPKPQPKIIDIPHEEVEQKQVAKPAFVSPSHSGSKCRRYFNKKKQVNRARNKVARLSRRKNRKLLKKKKY